MKAVAIRTIRFNVCRGRLSSAPRVKIFGAESMPIGKVISGPIAKVRPKATETPKSSNP